MRLACVLVHYHTPQLLMRAVAGLRGELEAVAGDDFELIVVDNGSDASEVEQLRSLPARVLEAPGNLGYAGGLDYGLRRCAEAEILFVGNPDLDPRGCVAPLVAQLSEAGVVGPRFYWDEQLRFVMPPSDPVDRKSVMAAARAHGDAAAARVARRAFRRHARRHWDATVPIRSHSLSGALLAFRREVWQRVGPFDEGFPLYFEETDWLERARRHRIEGRYVPAARVLHHHAVSTGAHPRSQEWFEQSALRFRRRHFGRRFTRRLERISVEPTPNAVGTTRSTSALPRPLDLTPWSGPAGSGRSGSGATSLWIEVSPTAVGFPAVGERLDPSSIGRDGWSAPTDLLAGLGSEQALIFLTDETGLEKACWELVVSATAD